jgi:glycosyltransferase involved in cell wall biosynthesis
VALGYDLIVASQVDARTDRSPLWAAYPMATTTESATSDRQQETLDVSVVIPCLNEAETIAICTRKAKRAMEHAGLSGEVIVVDNGSSDQSDLIAAEEGARVVRERRRGYGNAYLAGFAAARGRYIFMGDGDDTYDFNEIGRFVKPLEEGADMVMGSRLKGRIHRGAMPALHRYVGNPMLTRVLNLFYGSDVSDAHCGMRAFRSDALERLDLRMSGMEFASEMVIRASKAGLRIEEVPIEYHPRRGESKLRSFRDGWRHLRFLLVHSPTHLFVVPGVALFVTGLIAMLAVLLNASIFGRQWDLHAMIAAAMLAIAGTQIIGLGLSARAYGVHHLGERDPLFERYEGRVRLEHGLLTGIGLLVVGVALATVVLVTWISRGLGALGEERLAVLSLALIVVGMQVIFTSFLLSIIGLRRRTDGELR